MARYIDADKELQRLPNDLPYKSSIKRVLLQAEEADVVEVKHGYWIGKPIAGYSRIRCSVCRTSFAQETGTWLHCPECGAKMDGGGRE